MLFHSNYFTFEYLKDISLKSIYSEGALKGLQIKLLIELFSHLILLQILVLELWAPAWKVLFVRCTVDKMNEEASGGHETLFFWAGMGPSLPWPYIQETHAFKLFAWL